MTKHVTIAEAQAQLPELFAAAVRGEEVILGGLGLRVRLVPVVARTIEEITAAEQAMTPEDIERRAAKRRAGIGMYEHLVTGRVPTVRELKPTDEEILERERQKFDDLH